MKEVMITVVVNTGSEIVKRQWTLSEDEWNRRKAQTMFDVGCIVDLQCSDRKHTRRKS